MKRLCTLLALAYLLPSIARATTPTISNVSGTVSTGQTLTVTGSNMVDENIAGRDTSYNGGFEGANYTADSILLTGGSIRANCTASYSISEKLLGDKSLSLRNQGAYAGESAGQCSAYVFNGLGNDYYVSFYVKHNLNGGTWADYYMKLLLSGSDPATNQLYSQPVPTGTVTPPSQWRFSDGDLVQYAPLPYPMRNNAWHHVEIRYKNSAPKVHTIWFDGQLLYSGIPTGNIGADYMEFGTPNLDATGPSYDMFQYFDRFVMSTNRIYPASKIEIANSATYATATKRYQEPLYMSDGSVQLKTDLTGLGAGPYYLYITNNRQEVSAAYALSGGGGDTTPSGGIAISAGSMTIGAGTMSISTQ